jgi:Zinc carboxypeptidase
MDHPEMNRRLLHYYLDNYQTNRDIRRIIDTTELWFVPVANPDGYDLTFTDGNRLWRKNLRDNDGDGVITGNDGVDPNCNRVQHLLRRVPRHDPRNETRRHRRCVVHRPQACRRVVVTVPVLMAIVAVPSAAVAAMILTPGRRNWDEYQRPAEHNDRNQAHRIS